MASENLKSAPITNLDATPVVVATSGEGAPGAMRVATDSVLPTTNVSEYSTYRLCRFPTNAKVKHVWLFTNGIDQTTGSATLDINVAFSDSTVDGTPPALQGTIPSGNHDGTSIAWVNTTGYGTYTSTGNGNKLFGITVGMSTTGANRLQEVTFANIQTLGANSPKGFTPANRDDDLWDVFGFVNGQGVAQDPGGFFDIFVVIAAVVATATAGTIAVEVDYVV